MADKFKFHIVIDNNTGLSNNDPQLLNGIIKKLSPAIAQKAQTIIFYYLQPDAGPSRFDVPNYDPQKLVEKVDSLVLGRERRFRSAGRASPGRTSRRPTSEHHLHHKRSCAAQV